MSEQLTDFEKANGEIVSGGNQVFGNVPRNSKEGSLNDPECSKSHHGDGDSEVQISRDGVQKKADYVEIDLEDSWMPAVKKSVGGGQHGHADPSESSSSAAVKESKLCEDHGDGAASVLNTLVSIVVERTKGLVTEEQKDSAKVVEEGRLSEQYRDNDSGTEDSESDSELSSDSDESTSSSSESSSDDTTSSLSLSSIEEPQPANIVTPVRRLRGPRTPGEIDIYDLPPIEDLHISVPLEQLHKIGCVHALVDQLVVVESAKDISPLNLDSVLFFDGGKPLGKIFDVFGQVSQPFYAVRFNSPSDIIEQGIEKGQSVYYAPTKDDLTTFVFTERLRFEKGSDASWMDNNEPPLEHLDFSDDEQERIVKRKLRNKHNQNTDENDQSTSLPKYSKDERSSKSQNHKRSDFKSRGSLIHQSSFKPVSANHSVPVKNSVTTGLHHHHPPPPVSQPAEFGGGPVFSLFPPRNNFTGPVQMGLPQLPSVSSRPFVTHPMNVPPGNGQQNSCFTRPQMSGPPSSPNFPSYPNPAFSQPPAWQPPDFRSTSQVPFPTSSQCVPPSVWQTSFDLRGPSNNDNNNTSGSSWSQPSDGLNSNSWPQNWNQAQGSTRPPNFPACFPPPPATPAMNFGDPRTLRMPKPHFNGNSDGNSTWPSTFNRPSPAPVFTTPPPPLTSTFVQHFPNRAPGSVWNSEQRLSGGLGNQINPHSNSSGGFLNGLGDNNSYYNPLPDLHKILTTPPPPPPSGMPHS